MVYSAISDGIGTLSQFTRRKRIKLSHTGALTNYQKLLDVLYEVAMRSDFGDIRFNTLDGDYIPYWIKSKSDGISAEVWIKADLDDGDTYIYMYYGNSGLTSESDGSDVFIEFFDGSSLTGWTKVDTGNKLVLQNDRIEWVNLTRADEAYVYKTFSEANNSQLVFEYEYAMTSSTVNPIINIGVVHDNLDDAKNIDNGYICLRDIPTLNTSRCNIRISDTNYPGTYISDGVGTNLHYYAKTIRDGDTLTTYVYDDVDKTSLVGTSTVTQAGILDTLQYLSLVSSNNGGFSEHVGSGWVDNFIVRKYDDEEPTVIFGKAEKKHVVPIIM